MAMEKKGTEPVVCDHCSRPAVVGSDPPRCGRCAKRDLRGVDTVRSWTNQKGDKAWTQSEAISTEPRS